MRFRAAWSVALAAALAALAAAADHHGVHSAKALRERFDRSVEPFLTELALQFNAALRTGRIAVAEHGGMAPTYAPQDMRRTDRTSPAALPLLARFTARDYLPNLAVVVAEAHRRRPLQVDLAYLGALNECDDCKAEALPLQERFKSEASREFFNGLAKNICNRFELFSPHVCNGTVDIFTDVRSHPRTRGPRGVDVLTAIRRIGRGVTADRRSSRSLRTRGWSRSRCAATRGSAMCRTRRRGTSRSRGRSRPCGRRRRRSRTHRASTCCT